MMTLSFLKNEADAKDVAQEAFLKAYQNLSSKSKFRTWVISITSNKTRGRLLRMKAAPMQSLDGSLDEEGHVYPALLSDWRESPSDSLERSEMRQVLQEAIGGLPEIIERFLCFVMSTS
jgi:RNA polymerase sigma-70 factor (ECF subfamily)